MKAAEGQSFRIARLCAGALLLAAWALLLPTRAWADQRDDSRHWMNLGKAYLENRNSAQAIEMFQKAATADRNSSAALRNLARAHLLARQSEAALTALARAEKLSESSAATSYLTGLAYSRLSRFEEAIPYLEEAVRRDPETAALRYQLANAYQAAGNHEKAGAQLQETVRLDPLHTGAQYKLASYAQRAGDQAEFEKRHEEFLRLRKIFGDYSQSAEALERCVYTRAEIPPKEEGGRRQDTVLSPAITFRDVTEAAFPRPSDRMAAAVTVLEMDSVGAYTLIAADQAGGLALLKFTAEGTVERAAVKAGPLGPISPAACLVGDFHNSAPPGATPDAPANGRGEAPARSRRDARAYARNDVILLGSDKVLLLEQTAPGVFEDVTGKAGLGKALARRGRWVDFDHDGDLDLVLASAGGVTLWQNDGDGTFEDVTEQVGIEQTGPVEDLTAVDLDGNNAVDLMAAHGTRPTIVFENQRTGLFRPMPEPPGPWPPSHRLLANDLNNDGHPDAVLVGSGDAVILYGAGAGRERLSFPGTEASAAAFIDYDNDGWLDIIIAGSRQGNPQEGRILLYRNGAAPGWQDVSSATGLNVLRSPPAREILAADLDGDGDTDLLLLTSTGEMRFVRNDGGEAGGQMKLRLVTIKTNPSGFGIHVELRRGSFWLTREVTELPLEIGLAGHRRLDSVQTLWTDGVVLNEIDVEVGRTPLTLVEKDVETGSCPFLYVWGGRGVRFVTDLLGNSPLGLPERRGVMLPADPDEIVAIGGEEVFRPQGGLYTLQLTEEFREALYLDSASLIAVDHPEGVEVHPTDKVVSPPFPSSEVWAITSLRPPDPAEGSDGITRTDALRASDGVFAPPGSELPAPFLGACHPLTLTLDFGPLEVNRPLVLALTGWLQYGSASSDIAISQCRSVEVIPPSLEVETNEGGWRAVDVRVGIPAGKTKTILCDLAGKLPHGAKRLRLTTTYEIRWDRIALGERVFTPGERVHALAPISADLAWRGFSEIAARAPGHPTTPDYGVLLDRPPWPAVLEGWCTRYGEVLSLVADRDGRLAIVNAGDALTLCFGANDLPPTPPGFTRDFFFYSVGWCKDGDHNTYTGATVEPLPAQGRDGQAAPGVDIAAGSGTGAAAGSGMGAAADSGTGAAADWRLVYNTRWVSRDRFAY